MKFVEKTNQKTPNFLLVGAKMMMFAIAISFAITACGGDDKTPNPNNPSGNPNTSDLTASNWQSVIKDVYGFDLNVPAGWTFKKGAKTNINPAYYVQFTTTANDFEAEYSAFMQYIFDLTEAVSAVDGNYNADLLPFVKLERIHEIPKMMGIPFPLWYFDSPKYSIQISLDDAASTKIAQITLVAVKTL